MANGTTRHFGPFPADLFADPTTGLTTVTHSFTTSVTCAVWKLSAASVMAGASVKVNGLRELHRKLKDYDNDLKRELERHLKEAGDIVATGAATAVL